MDCRIILVEARYRPNNEAHLPTDLRWPWVVSFIACYWSGAAELGDFEPRSRALASDRLDGA
jgi:hypothetical protein